MTPGRLARRFVSSVRRSDRRPAAGHLTRPSALSAPRPGHLPPRKFDPVRRARRRFLLKVLSAAALALLAALAALQPAGLEAQTPARAGEAFGRIVGRIIDAQSGEGLASVGVEVDGTPLVTISGVDGRFTFARVPAGIVTLRIQILGYSPKIVTGVLVPAGSSVEQNVSLNVQALQLQGIEVSAAAERGSVSRALDEQRNAAGIVNGIASEQIRRSPDSNAGQAVQRVSGVTVQDGRYIFVRGLGERYTTTSLNNARIPSPDPERKVVPLDVFPAGLLETITTSKTFTPDQPGDFSGAQVNLKTREFPLGRVLNVSASTGFNSAVVGEEMPRAPAVGADWIAFGARERRLPVQVRAAGDLRDTPAAELPALLGSFRNVWSADRQGGRANGGFGITVGGEDPVFGQPVGYLGSLLYSYGQDVRRDERRAVAVAGEGPQGTRAQNAYAGSSGTTSVLWGGLVNVSARLGAATKLSVNNTFTRSADNQATHLGGTNEEFARLFDVTRLTYTERAVRSNQIAGTHLFRERHKLDWSGTLSGVSRHEPDRSDLVYEAERDPATGAVRPTLWFGAPRSATRTFSELQEDGADFAVSYQFAFGHALDRGALKVGALHRRTDRQADTRAYDIVNYTLEDSEREGEPESVFSDAHIAAGHFLLRANANGGRYTADDRLLAGFFMLDLPVTARVRFVGGARVEGADIAVDTRTPQGFVTEARLENTDVLPSLAVNVKLGEAQSLRLSASRTLSRPEYRELSPVAYFDILGGLTIYGNPHLKRALIQNYDARWEWYPERGEVVSLALFAKRFDNPIERIVLGGTGFPTLGFVNAEAAHNYGVELELRKGLGVLLEALSPLSVFANATLMRSDIEPGNDSISSLTSANRPMVGQAEYVLNAGLGYTHPERGLNATLLYNVVGDRIVEAGALPLPDAYEHARHMLDASIEVPIGERASLKLDAKNLLDAPFRITQGSVSRLEYRAGRSFSLGATWRP